MTQQNNIELFKKMLLPFVVSADPILEMLQWLFDILMDMEISIKTGAEKGKHAEDRKTYRSGYRVRRFDTRMGTLYMLVPKVRNGGYLPFFYNRKETVGAGTNRNNSKSVHKWRINPENRAACKKHGN